MSYEEDAEITPAFCKSSVVIAILAPLPVSDAVRLAVEVPRRLPVKDKTMTVFNDAKRVAGE